MYLNSKSSRIQHIADATNHEKGYKPNSENYGYDDNGNMTYDPQRKITIAYNHLNLTTQMTKPDNSKLVNIYDAGGTKWQQIEYDAIGTNQKRSYIGGMEFLGNSMELAHHNMGFIRNLNAAAADNLVLSGNATRSQSAQNISSVEQMDNALHFDYQAAQTITLHSSFSTKNGATANLTIAPISTALDYEWQYRIADHLGNTRVLFADKDRDGLIRQSTDQTTNEVLGFYNYSVFSLELGGSQLNASNNQNRSKLAIVA